jgi:hypothetical protein
MSKEKFHENEARAFIKAHPDYEPTHENRDRLMDALEARNLELTCANLTALWEEMKAKVN